jgi:hypothetical protein
VKRSLSADLTSLSDDFLLDLDLDSSDSDSFLDHYKCDVTSFKADDIDASVSLDVREGRQMTVYKTGWGPSLVLKDGLHHPPPEIVSTLSAISHPSLLSFGEVLDAANPRILVTHRFEPNGSLESVFQSDAGSEASY